MKRAVAIGIAAVAVLVFARSTDAITCPSGGCSILVSATVNATSSLDCTVKQFQNVSGTDVDQGEVALMNFGTLLRRFETADDDGDGIPNEPLALIGNVFFKVFCGINAAGADYTLSQAVSSFSPSGGLDGGFVFVPIQATTDGNPANPISGTMGNCDLAVNATTWFASNQAGVVEAVYSITDVSPHLASVPPATCTSAPSGFTPIAPGTPAATYTTSVTWSLTVL